MYASSLKQSLILKEDPLNGTKIIERLKNKIYKSAMGYMVRMDENGDAEGNYSLVTLDTINGIPGIVIGRLKPNSVFLIYLKSIFFHLSQFFGSFFFF